MLKEQFINSIFYPRKHHKNDEKDILIDAENDKIAIRLFLKDSSCPTILFFHGNAEICQDYDEIGSIYNNFNINLIVSDDRGYGLSTGTPNKQNLHSDSLTVLDYVCGYLSANKYNSDLFVMGRSLGSASASHLMLNRSKYFKGVIIESGFATEYPLSSPVSGDLLVIKDTGAYGAVFGVFFAQKLANKPLTIVGNGNQTRDFIHVKDLVNGIIKAALSKKKNKIYNIGGGKEVKVNKIAKLVGGKKIHIPKRPGEPYRSLANISKIKKDLNWKPKRTFDSLVEEMMTSDLALLRDGQMPNPFSE